MIYSKKARLIEDISKIEQYHPILEKDNFQIDESHWRMLSKNTISLFQVLIDQDLSDLVNVLEHYPRYIQWVCEHFRYAYSYSENDADINSASKLLSMGEPYFSRQFVRNVIRKLPKLDGLDLKEIGEFILLMQIEYINWHPVVVNHYSDTVVQAIEDLNVHPLQRIALKKPIINIIRYDTFEYDAEDRDAVLDIPYMN